MPTAPSKEFTFAFQTSPYPSLRHLRVESPDEETLVIRGSVRSFHQKQLAQETLRQLHRTAQIHNLLEVHPRDLSLRTD